MEEVCHPKEELQVTIDIELQIEIIDDDINNIIN